MLEKPRRRWALGGLGRLRGILTSLVGGRRPSTRLAPRGPVLRFGEFELELETGHLTQLDATIKIQPQPARVLQYLAEHPGILVTRDELRVHLWGEDHHVNFDQGLNFCIQQVRQALDDSARTPTFIETIPRRGYRFLMPVERSDPDASPPVERWSARAKASAWLVILGAAIAGVLGLGMPSGAPRQSTRLAVLPFSAAGGQAQEQLLAELIGEQLSGHLVRALPESIGVVAARDLGRDAVHRRTSELGKELKSDLLLQGDIVRDGDRLRVLVRLIRAADGVHLWAGIYEISTDSEDWPRRFGQVAGEIALELDGSRRAGLGGGLVGATRAALYGLASRVLLY